MKELSIMMACLFFYEALKAQTWSEWFQQNSTQLSYLQEQIAALQLYNSTQQTGYAVSQNGLVEIDSTEEEDWAEFEAYFSARRTASHEVLADPRIQDIDILCERCGLIADAISTLGLLRNPEPADWAELSDATAKDIEQSVDGICNRMYDILLPQEAEMSDAEREQVIGELQRSIHSVYKKAAYQLEIMTKQPILP
jgi:hypothetical protein